MPTPRVVPDPIPALAGRPATTRHADRALRAGAVDDVTDGWPPLAGGPLDACVADSQPAPRGAAQPPTPPALAQLAGRSLDQYLHRVEAECIAAALQVSGGNKSQAARLLGIKRSTLGDRIVRCGLQV